MIKISKEAIISCLEDPSFQPDWVLPEIRDLFQKEPKKKEDKLIDPEQEKINFCTWLRMNQ